MRAKSSILFLCLLAAFAGAALAQTPDGQTPAQETVCDGFSGASFGLCNAYCEAMDCELENDGDPNTNPSASSNACDKVRANFSQKSNIAEADVDGACSPCPCSVATKWPAADPQVGDPTWNTEVSNGLAVCHTNTANLILAHNGNSTTWVSVDSSALKCEYGTVGTEGEIGTADNTLSGLTTAEAAACVTLVKSKSPCT